jgi:hypothetical protein
MVEVVKELVAYLVSESFMDFIVETVFVVDIGEAV